MPDRRVQWRLRDFDYWLDLWIDVEDPDEQVRWAVGGWIQSRLEDPYRGVERVAGFDNLWFGPVPAAPWRRTYRDVLLLY